MRNVYEQKTSREGLFFHHGATLYVLQNEFKQVRDKQQDERLLLAKRIHELRRMQELERKSSICPVFDCAAQGKT